MFIFPLTLSQHYKDYVQFYISKRNKISYNHWSLKFSGKTTRSTTMEQYL